MLVCDTLGLDLLVCLGYFAFGLIWFAGFKWCLGCLLLCFDFGSLSGFDFCFVSFLGFCVFLECLRFVFALVV